MLTHENILRDAAVNICRLMSSDGNLIDTRIECDMPAVLLVLLVQGRS
jgi:hypothetical protein